MNTTTIDTNLELEHLIEHVKHSWVNIPHLDEVMTLAWTMALEKTKHMFDQYGFFEMIDKIEEQRKYPKKWNNLSQEEFDYLTSYDAIYNIGYNLSMGSSQLERIIMKDWNYSDVCTQIESAIKEQYDIKKLKPKGWLKMAKNYNDFDGMEDFDEDTVKSKFKGIDSGGAVSGNFTYRTSLAQVMYDDKAQGRKPFHTLVGAIVGHAYAVSKKNTTIEMIDDLNKITEHYLKPEFFDKIVLDIDTAPFVKNNTLKALLAIREKDSVSEEEFNLIVKQSKEAKQHFEALSPEDKKVVLEKRAKEFEERMKSFSYNDPQTKKDLALEKKKEDEQYALVMSILNSSTKKKAKP